MGARERENRGGGKILQIQEKQSQKAKDEKDREEKEKGIEVDDSQTDESNVCVVFGWGMNLQKLVH